MKLARVRTRGVLRPADPLLIVAIALVVVLAACGSATGTGSPDSSDVGTPSSSADVSGGVGPGATPTGPASSEPGSSGLDAPTPQPSVSAGGPDAAAATCFGSAKTRDFFVAIAEAVAWPVYCAVLPIGWSVESGSYHLANGGQMVISYKTAAGAHLQVEEGHWCTGDAATCAPRDADIGPASFGDQSGELVTANGGMAVYVSAGQDASWTASATGLDEATFRQICADLALVSP